MLGFVSTTLEQLWMLPFDVLLELALGGRLVLARSTRVPDILVNAFDVLPQTGLASERLTAQVAAGQGAAVGQLDVLL